MLLATLIQGALTHYGQGKDARNTGYTIFA